MEYKMDMGDDPELTPIKVGEAAALGRKLLKVDRWLRVGASGRAEMIEVRHSL